MNSEARTSEGNLTASFSSHRTYYHRTSRIFKKQIDEQMLEYQKRNLSRFAVDGVNGTRQALPTLYRLAEGTFSTRTRLGLKICDRIVIWKSLGSRDGLGIDLNYFVDFGWDMVAKEHVLAGPHLRSIHSSSTAICNSSTSCIFNSANSQSASASLNESRSLAFSSSTVMRFSLTLSALSKSSASQASSRTKDAFSSSRSTRGASFFFYTSSFRWALVTLAFFDDSFIRAPLVRLFSGNQIVLYSRHGRIVVRSGIDTCIMWRSKRLICHRLICHRNCCSAAGRRRRFVTKGIREMMRIVRRGSGAACRFSGVPNPNGSFFLAGELAR
ncbi:hypothetical protein C4D60_Mb01t32490 [Musa balbisiana]|uniref:Uncharacterized protein n=1 Tax=Musa balbisiana TaxID=52838 RepID=A0A4S8JSB4_MUSBA|nr:hypothetical protein C4D60_Mb01t32490 [Musa balbisiana]